MGILYNSIEVNIDYNYWTMDIFSYCEDIFK